MSSKPLRSLPSVYELLESPPLKLLIGRISRSALVSTVGTVLDEVRREVQTAAAEMTLPSVTDLAERIARRIGDSEPSSSRTVINATGVVLHAGLGPAPLPEEAVAEMARVAREYTSQDPDSSAGPPSRRIAADEDLLRTLTGAEAALVVNSKAGATVLALAALAATREVIVARSQLIETDDGGRLSDMVLAAGAVLREVGAVNYVRLDDYTQVVGASTAAIMLAHPSNCAIVGGSGGVALAELVETARRYKLPVIHDVGFGALFDARGCGFPDEPLVAESVKTGADVVLFAGDKLLGGPQCGIIVGRKTMLEKIARHPLAGALRADKLTAAALAATLRLYRDPEKVRFTVPLLQLLTTSVENLKNRAERLALQAAATPTIAEAQAVAGESCLIGGSRPDRRLPTWCISLRPKQISADQLAAALRAGEPSVIGRVQEDRVLLDLRSVLPRQDIQLIAALSAATTAAD